MVLSIAMRMQTSPSRLMMPLVCRADKRHDDAGGDAAEPGSRQVICCVKAITASVSFSVTPIRLVVLVLGILYMFVMRFVLKGMPRPAARRLDASNLSQSYP
ncbi:hypothetical protein ACNKHL_14225 [Shigella flexneri]